MSVTAYHFWSPTCAPCKVIKPAIEDLKEEFPQVHWISVNTHDDSYNYADVFGVKTVPTIVFVTKNERGILIENNDDRHSGTTMMGYYRILRKCLKMALSS